MDPSKFGRRALQRLLFPARALCWTRVFARLRPTHVSDYPALVAAAIADTLLLPPRRDREVFAKARRALTVWSPSSGASFHVRAGTDDLYLVLPGRERDVHDAILGPLRAGDSFVDVGANIGYYSVLGARRVGPKGRVIAIEAVPTTADQLERNVSLNKLENVHIVRALASSTRGERQQVYVKDSLFGMASRHAGPDTENVSEIETVGSRLDDVCRGEPRIRVAKLDVEGAELDVLRGAAEMLARTDRIVVECTRDKREIVELLETSGFRVRSASFMTYVIGVREQDGR